jgi:uncharacterized protein YPO0396
MSGIKRRADGAEEGEQFRLTRLQTFNWGTFNGVLDLAIAEVGYLFVGPSGSGKSTLLDAHAALLTPPKWVDFNVAAREAERNGKDRNLVTYVRGAWAQHTGDNGEYVQQYLRKGTTFSAIAESYRNARGQVVVLAQVLWIRGNSTAASDVKKLYLVLEREFSVRELAFFAERDFNVRGFRSELADAFVKEEFSAYQERFRALLGIDNELALRLLHKTQSAKNLGDLDVFLRDFMLDAPQTFAVAERLVSEFGELNAAHQAVVAAKRQIETLAPARKLFAEREGAAREKNVLDEVSLGVDTYREQQRERLLRARITQLGVELEGAQAESERLAQLVDREADALSDLKLKRKGLGGGLIEQLQQQLERAGQDRPERLRKRSQVVSACRALAWDVPETAPAFSERVAAAQQRLLDAQELDAQLERSKDALKEQRRDKEQAFRAARDEVAAMERQRSNIPARMLAVRAALTDDLGISEQALPFAGELLEVRKDAAAWQGAIERVLHSFAQSLLVDDQHYPAVAAYLNEHSIGERVVYLRVAREVEERRTPSHHSLVRKLSVAPGPHAAWLDGYLAKHFDYECAETVLAFRNAARAVTKEGQVKHNLTRHEKDDRRRVDDRARWVLGFDNKEKLKLFKQTAAELGAELARLGERLESLGEQANRQRGELMHCQLLANLRWREVDVSSLLAEIESLGQRIRDEQGARPELAKLDVDIRAQEAQLKLGSDQLRDWSAKVKTLSDEQARLERKLKLLLEEHLGVALTPIQLAQLQERFARVPRSLALDTLDQATTEVVRLLESETKALAAQISELTVEIERRFAEFNRHWPAEAGGLDAKLASAYDYFGKLTRLETDGLPRYEERFMQLLHDQSDQNLTLLSARLDQERSAIRARLELVNESLGNAQFNRGTHLIIETIDKSIEQVRQFKQLLKEALSQSFREDAELAERRFEVLSALVKRLSSQEAADRSWRGLVLDVRQHVEFVARELDGEEREVEVYRSGAGKSGGQRQKLAATVLAAALRYQLGGGDREPPRFATVVLDEAFDKADSEFTAMAMNIFKTFGFQMVIATPLKSVMTLEPFIGGACFVNISERKHSAVRTIDYDIDAKRLDLPRDPEHEQEAAVA